MPIPPVRHPVISGMTSQEEVIPAFPSVLDVTATQKGLDLSRQLMRVVQSCDGFNFDLF